jgi:hypothetical protein
VTTTGGKIEVEPVGGLVPLVGLIGANVELVALSLTVCVWPRASETENSNNPVKTKTETRLPQKHLDMIFFISVADLGQTDISHNFRSERDLSGKKTTISVKAFVDFFEDAFSVHARGVAR